MKAKIAILGASGYTGVELLRILRNYPGVEIVDAKSEVTGTGRNPLQELYSMK